MDENTAWNCFKHTGSVQDYLIYSQCRHIEEEEQPQEGRDEDRRRGLGYHGEMRG